MSEYLDRKNPNLYLNSTEKLIISYGIACAMEFLHSRRIIHRDLRPGNIFLDSRLHPQIFNFSVATNIDNSDEVGFRDSSLNKEMDQLSAAHMSPEFILDLEKYSTTFSIDVFSYAITLYEINIGPNTMTNSKQSLLMVMKKISEGGRPEFPDSSPSSWRNLIERCWDQDPNKRPTFTEICDLLESSIFVNPTINISAFNDYKKIVKPFRPSHK